MLPNIKNPSGFKFSIFDPLIALGNVAIYDGDVNLSAASWRDRSGGNQITFFNAPTYNAAGLNGHGTILFNGVNQYGNSITPLINSPYTIYLVLRQITWTNGDVICTDGINSTILEIYQVGSTPRVDVADDPDTLTTNDLLINTWNIMSIVMNGSNSVLKIGSNITINGTLGNNIKRGFNLASDLTLFAFGNIQFAYMIMRNVADPTWLQNNFINWLKNRFAI